MYVSLIVLQRQSSQCIGRRKDVAVLLVLDYMPIAQDYVTAGKLRQFRIVRNENNRTPLAVQALEKGQYLERRTCIEVSRSLVRQYYHRDRSPSPLGYGHSLLLPARHLVGTVVYPGPQDLPIREPLPHVRGTAAPTPADCTKAAARHFR